MIGLHQKKFKIIPSLVGGIFLLISIKACTPDTPVPALTSEQCLTVNAFYEAKGEGVKGMQAVSAVVYNRVQSKMYPNSVCKVIFQKSQFSWTHQQSQESIRRMLEGDTRHLNRIDKQAYLSAKRVSRMPQKEVQKVLPSTKVLWYHASTVSPKWCSKGIQVAQIGSHLFYVKKT